MTLTPEVRPVPQIPEQEQEVDRGHEQEELELEAENKNWIKDINNLILFIIFYK